MTAVSSGIGEGGLCENSNKLVVSTKCRLEKKQKKQSRVPPQKKHPTLVIRKNKCLLEPVVELVNEKWANTELPL